MKTSVDQLARQLGSELGGDHLSADPNTLAAHTVDGQRSRLLCAPTSAEQVGKILQLCGTAQAAVIPWGGGTAMALGNPPRQADVVVQLHRLDRVLDHDHANLTVTAQSGITLSALQSALAQQNQFVPFDAPFPDRSTIGGVVAANLNGPRRLSHGSVRDLVIGMKLVLAGGERIRAGGKVVKNVAGYDMCKLFTGSLGTLGIITEVTVRVAPIAATGATVVVSGTLTQALELSSAVANSKLLPTAFFLRSKLSAQNWQVLIAFEGFATAVARQVSAVIALAQGDGLTAQPLELPQQQLAWREIGDFPLQQERLIYRVTVPRAASADILRVLLSWPAGADAPEVVADIAMGTVWIALAPEKRNVARFAELISLAQRHQGHAVMFVAPFELKSGIDVWGPASSTLKLMCQIKQQFDPEEILNPGRFIGGL